VKLLLLGPGESGKSTIFKQLKLIQTASKGFTDQERTTWKQIVQTNCIDQMRLLTKAALTKELPLSPPSSSSSSSSSVLSWASEENKNYANFLAGLTHSNGVWTPAIGKAIKSLWQDPTIRTLFSKARSLDLQLNDTAEYFFSHIDRFLVDNYLPTDADILRTRIRSTGIEEATFAFDKMVFKVIDVGGQRSERKKWIHCFECVKCILFVAALSDYDLNLREQATEKRMDEALHLFEDVTGSTYFTDTAIILFLNKVDLFQQKIQSGVDLRMCFSQYTGGPDFKVACEYVKKRFLERVANGKTIYLHFTCAIDTQNIEHVINDVRSTVLTSILEEVNGFM